MSPELHYAVTTLIGIVLALVGWMAKELKADVKKIQGEMIEDVKKITTLENKLASAESKIAHLEAQTDEHGKVLAELLANTKFIVEWINERKAEMRDDRRRE